MPKKPVTRKRPRTGTSKRNVKRRKRVARVRTAPRSSPNVYRFTRGFDSFSSIGETAGIFAMNTDNKYQIIDLHTKFADLPDYTEFNSLFSEYKITGFDVQLVPTHKSNLALVQHNPDGIPNYEVFVIPANYTDDELNFALFDGPTIDSYLNQTQRKRMMVFPNRPKTYVTTKPKIVKYQGPTTKSGGVATQAMGSPCWLSTAAPTGTFQDERTVVHYGQRLLIRRVDGLAMNNVDPSVQAMGFRVHHQVHFLCRKVQ